MLPYGDMVRASFVLYFGEHDVFDLIGGEVGEVKAETWKNCWEVKQCGRGPDSAGKDGRPVCPAAAPGKFDGINRGMNAGRFCWAVAGTFCNGQMQGRFARKFVDCLHCDFFQQVDLEEGRFLVLTPYDAEMILAGQRARGDSPPTDMPS